MPRSRSRGAGSHPLHPCYPSVFVLAVLILSLTVEKCGSCPAFCRRTAREKSGGSEATGRWFRLKKLRAEIGLPREFGRLADKGERRGRVGRRPNERSQKRNKGASLSTRHLSLLLPLLLPGAPRGADRSLTREPVEPGHRAYSRDSPCDSSRVCTPSPRAPATSFAEEERHGPRHSIGTSTLPVIYERKGRPVYVQGVREERTKGGEKGEDQERRKVGKRERVKERGKEIEGQKRNNRKKEEGTRKGESEIEGSWRDGRTSEREESGEGEGTNSLVRASDALVTERRTDRRTDRPTDRQTDAASPPLAFTASWSRVTEPSGCVSRSCSRSKGSSSSRRNESERKREREAFLSTHVVSSW